MRNLKKALLGSVMVLGAHAATAQYKVNENTHSHNDYLQNQPFYTAHSNHFASLEIDVFLQGRELLVAHTSAELDVRRTIEKLYLEPLLREINLNDGKAYKNGDHLQLMIDLKTAGAPTMKVLEEKLKPIRQYFDVKNNPNAVRVVISGDVPPADQFRNYDELFFFDGKAGFNYTPEQLTRIAFFSAPLQRFSKWNGLGRMVEEDYSKVKQFVDSVHQVGKPVRFWGNPDTKTCWQAFIKLGVDYLNTDSPAEMARFLNTYPDNNYLASVKHTPYRPTYKSDVTGKKPKNVILLISDGAGFSQLWAAATANGGLLNATNFRHLGFSNTAPANDYNTDSAAGATAMSTGEKTNNRYIGMDSAGKAIPTLVEELSALGMRCGVVSNDRVTGATPSSFFAHRKERDQADSIAADLLKSPIALVIAGKHKTFDDNNQALTNKLKAKGFEFGDGLASLNGLSSKKQVICFDGDRPDEQFHMIEHAFEASVKFLGTDAKKGFFLMIEGAKIDGGGHGNKIKQCIDEYLSFDKVLGEALQFADQDGETLVLVTSDHETGGLILYDGNYKTGSVTGTFTTNDHTGLPVPLLSYGPGADQFTGFIQNSDIPNKVKAMLKK
ncbi:alkaline phosphatase [Pedobacter sp. BAL39]|uniref:alkaline phosphatase n=1 Tax=Pedobacter sp. BAL39 TaxID=391596 RepID=UPI0001559B2F|nr:alkaline phosphatase [Pedobacter sp. BAL39]EDM35478.1 alkaline phosphatase [Pedobacter sp. BAL39]